MNEISQYDDMQVNLFLRIFRSIPYVVFLRFWVLVGLCVFVVFGAVTTHTINTFGMLYFGSVSLLGLMLAFGFQGEVESERIKRAIQNRLAVQPFQPGLLMKKDLNRSGHFIYVIQDLDITGYCKIGRTNNVGRRLRRFEIVLPFKWSIVHVIECDDEIALENQLHYRFRARRRAGEWFELSLDDVDWIRRL